MVLEIEIPENKEKEVIGVLKALGIKIKSTIKNPNKETEKAILEARAGNIQKIEDINSFLDNL
ncbi:MAG: hypothetical protein ABIP95_12355 [Pelobium sp.]